jgi:lysophospholipase L1-like esterase
VFATTTPVPEGGVKPFRDTGDPARYNEVAREIMRKNNIPINDLYEFCRLRPSLQKPVDVHFTPEGYQELAGLVQREIYSALKRKQSKDTEKKSKTK